MDVQNAFKKIKYNIICLKIPTQQQQTKRKKMNKKKKIVNKNKFITVTKTPKKPVTSNRLNRHKIQSNFQ